MEFIVSLRESFTCICVEENVMYSMISNIAACLLADCYCREVRCMHTAAEGFTTLGIRLSGNIRAVLYADCSHSNRAET